MVRDAHIDPDLIWTGDINRQPGVRDGFDRTRTVRFYDTTLRDGEQAVGVVFSADAKYEIACQVAGRDRPPFSFSGFPP